MHGNVRNWCWDFGNDSDHGSSAPVTDPTGLPTGLFRAVRGGSWRNPAGHCRSAFRRFDDPGYGGGNDTGLRVVRNGL